jgi:2-phospho-L-lactate guanylyltransferase
MSLSRAHVVIAVRGGPNAKSRCADRLDEGEREHLVEAMLGDMLDALAGSTVIRQVHVATPTPSLARLAGARPGVSVILEQPAGLNAAFENARRRVAAEDPDAALALMPGDLPLLDRTELEAALAQVAPGRVGLVAASADGGTGAVLLPAGTPFAFAFGPDSFNRHLAVARQADLAPFVVDAPSLAFDVDGPLDLDRLAASGRGLRSAGLLGSISRVKATCP